jgi:type VI protein secretion system component VasK
MNSLPFFLADEDTEQILASWRISDPATRERFLIFGSLGLVTLLVLLWAVFLRKRRRRRRLHHHSHQHSPGPAEVPESPREESAPAPEEKRRRHRRSRRRHRQRNPTLAETGGLPPIRPEEASEAEP